MTSIYTTQSGRWHGYLLTSALAWLACGSPEPAIASPCMLSTTPADTAMKRLQQAWQSQQQPIPMRQLHTEGTLPHYGLYDASRQARRDLGLMRDAALAWRDHHDPRWLSLSQQFLLSWVSTYQPSLNPIDETSFDSLIATYHLIKDALPSPSRQQVHDYLQRWGYAYANAMAHPGRQGTWRNNWQSHRVKLLTLIAVSTDDHKLFALASSQFQRQLDANLLANGEVIDYQQRDALHYVVYDLEPLLQAALAARRYDQDWYHRPNQAGASLASAVAWLQPYANGQQQHQEYVHSSVAFDAARAAAGLPGFKGNFEPARAATVYWLAAQWDPALLGLAQQLQPQPPAELIAECQP